MTTGPGGAESGPDAGSTPSFPRKPTGKRRRASDRVPGGRDRVTTKTETVTKPAESKAEMTARLERDSKDHDHALWERRVVVWLVVAAVSLLAIVSVLVVFLPKLSDQRGTAMNALVGIATSLVGYSFGSRRRAPE